MADPSALLRLLPRLLASEILLRASGAPTREEWASRAPPGASAARDAEAAAVAVDEEVSREDVCVAQAVHGPVRAGDKGGDLRLSGAIVVVLAHP